MLFVKHTTVATPDSIPNHSGKNPKKLFVKHTKLAMHIRFKLTDSKTLFVNFTTVATPDSIKKPAVFKTYIYCIGNEDRFQTHREKA